MSGRPPAAPPALDVESLDLLREALDALAAGFADLPPRPAPAPAERDRVRAALLAVADRLRDNYPYFHPLYAGQMLKPPHAVARLAYALALWINPNNHALDGGRATSALEKEAVSALARMVGWREHLGHLCGGGTMANLEALWVAGRLAPGTTVLASSQAHYTQDRISAVLGLPFETVPCDALGRMDLERLGARLEAGGVGTVVATLGTTGTGAVDPLPGILALRARHGFRLHVDAAYGGYFTLADGLSAPARAAFDALERADSIVIDPHKHGLQPYGCGCVLFRDPSLGRFYRHDSPYTYFSSAELHLGEISLECSRPGAAAAALWATQRTFPLEPGGTFAGSLGRGLAAARTLHARLVADPRVAPGPPPELDIVTWAIAAPDTARASELARRVFAEAAGLDLHLALADLPVEFFAFPAGTRARAARVTALRSVLMKPEHLDWIEAILERLERATAAALAREPRV